MRNIITSPFFRKNKDSNKHVLSAYFSLTPMGGTSNTHFNKSLINSPYFEAVCNLLRETEKSKSTDSHMWKVLL